MTTRKLFKKSFDAGKCKTSLKLATSRVRLLRNKRQEQLRVYRRNLAQLLQSGDEQTAKARVEHVFREENTVEAYDFIESYCEQIVARLSIIESQKKCPLDLEEAISTIVFAAPRCADLVELTDIRNHFAGKYGKDFISASLELRAGCRVNRNVIDKLSAKLPDGATKLKILTAIAKEHNINWDPSAVEEQLVHIPEDKLAGPTEFMSATSLAPELPSVPKHAPGPKIMDNGTIRNLQTGINVQGSQFPTNPSQLDGPIVPPSQDVSRTPSVMNAPDPGISKTNASMKSESRSQGPDISTQSKQENVPLQRSSWNMHFTDKGPDISTQSKQENVPLQRSSWNMHFTDATAAAQAAAESAELASIAARAAAELSSLERMSRQNSAESNEPPHGNRGSLSNISEIQTDTKMEKRGLSHTSSQRKSVDRDLHKIESGSQKEDLNGERCRDVRSGSNFSESWTENPRSVFGTTNIRSSISPNDVEYVNSRRETVQSAYDIPQFDTDEEGDSFLVEDGGVESNIHAEEVSSINSEKSSKSGNDTTEKVTGTIPFSSSKRDTNTELPDTIFESSPALDNTDVSSEEETNNFIPMPGIRHEFPLDAHNVSFNRGGPHSLDNVVSGSIGSSRHSRSEEGSIDEKKLSALDDPDSEYESDLDESFVYNNTQKNSSHGRKGFLRIPEKTATKVGQPQTFLQKDDYLDQVTIVTDTGGLDPDPSIDSSSEGLSTLNFQFSGFGGLRNKGYTRPPYVKHPSRKHLHDIHAQDHTKDFDTNDTSSSLNKNQAASKWTNIRSSRDSDDNIHSEKNKSNDSLGSVYGREKEQDTGPYKPSLSGDLWQSNINPDDHDVSASFGSNIHMKGRSTEPDSDSKDREKGKPRSPSDISGSKKPSQFKSYEGQTASKGSAYVIKERKSRAFSYYDLDDDEPVDTHTTLDLGENIRDSRRGGSSHQNAASQAGEKSKPVVLDEISESTEPSEVKAEPKSYKWGKQSRQEPVFDLKKYPRGGPSYNFGSDSDDEPSNERVHVNPKENVRLRGSVRSTKNHAIPLQSDAHGDLRGGPLNTASSLEFVTEESMRTKSIPVTPGSEAGSGRAQNIRQSSSRIMKEDLKPSHQKVESEPHKVETRTSNTLYDPVVSYKDESTGSRKEMHPNVVPARSEFGAASHYVLGPQPPERVASRFSDVSKVPDADGGLHYGPSETKTKLEHSKIAPKDVISRDSRTEPKTTDMKKASSSVVETASPRAPHVHPKLPDYDSIFAQFGRRQK